MTPDDDNETVLYEIDYVAEAAIEGPFDTWLRDHTADVLQFDGFLSAELLDDDTAAPPGQVRRLVQYRLRNRAALETYLREHAPRMRAQGIEKFGERYRAQRRVLAHREEFIRGAFSTENCLNCGEVLRGQHCSHCGQRAKVRVLSLGTLLRDLLGDITNFDSRIWRTLKPLAFKPGALTVEYLRGRRTYYSPPFRMYLILSVAFFLLTTVGGNPADVLNFEVDSDGNGGANVALGSGQQAAPAPDDGVPAPGIVDSKGAPVPAAAKTPAATPKLDPERERIIDEIVKRIPERADRAQARAALEQDFGAMTPQQVAPIKRFMDDPCGPDNLKLGIGLSKKYEDNARDACRKIAADGKGFGRAVYENIPKMMFIFLPLIAVVMFVLYLGSGRFYVEHLLFFVHFHAFFFLCGIAILVLERSSSMLVDTVVGSGLKTAEDVLTAVVVFYVPYYLYRAMRRVYGQGRIVTLLKYSLLLVGYLAFMTLTVLGLLAYTALTL
ncbi:MAG: DUF4286 family protein [Steroidobacteraceae bacterium]|nr:DUF4286 family protein [Pseudomonadota bacterium]MBP6107225.1 DUF4286 family protein [Steroidobacteraceae bacterium]MBP7014207.1 DUF4286 family protein [Steroidobacteraceae bacterium]